MVLPIAGSNSRTPPPLWNRNGVTETSSNDTFRELRVRLGSLRAFIAGVKLPALEELDSLLSVAQAEVERAAAQNKARALRSRPLLIEKHMRCSTLSARREAKMKRSQSI